MLAHEDIDPVRKLFPLHIRACCVRGNTDCCGKAIPMWLCWGQASVDNCRCQRLSLQRQWLSLWADWRSAATFLSLSRHSVLQFCVGLPPRHIMCDLAARSGRMKPCALGWGCGIKKFWQRE